MNDVISQVLGYLRGIWRFRWLVFVVAWPVAIGGWIFVSQMPDKYEAKARVFVDTRSVLTPLLRGLAIQSDIGNEVKLITKTIFSRPNLEKIARMTDMDLKAETDQDMNEILARIKGNLQLASGRGGDNLFQISYMDPDPKLAKNVVQSLLTVFIESALGDKRKDSDSAQRFIQEQISEYENKLTAAENRLTAFKQKNMAALSSVGGSYASLKAAVTELSDVQLLKKEAEFRRNELQRQLEDLEDDGEEDSLLDYSAAIGMSSDPRIQRLEAKRDELLLRFTSKHPDIVALDKTIESITKRNQDNQDIVAVKPKNTGLESSPVYQQMKLSLGEAEANLASLNVREQEYQDRVRKIEDYINNTPAVETELNRLDRDYNINKKNYELLVSRRESAKLGEEAGESSESVKFRVIDPPFVGEKPVSPNRPIMMSTVFVASLIAGLVFPLFLSLIKPSIDSVKSLQDLTQLRVLGAVSIIRTETQSKRRRLELMSFLLMGAVLAATYAGVMALTLSSENIFHLF